MFQQTYFVPRSTGTLTDSLLAYGLAVLLRALIQHSPGRRPHSECPVRIEDAGATFTIHLPEVIREEWLASSHIPTDLVLPVLRVPKPKDPAKIKVSKKPKAEKRPFPAELTPIDYNAIWDGIRSVTALITEQKQAGKFIREEIEKLRDSLHSEQPHRDVALLIGEYRMQVEAIHNQAAVQWFTTTQAGYQAANLAAILALFASPQADADKIARVWAKEVKIDGVRPRLTASQVFNPGLGKGQNRPKADQLVMGNEEHFWLLEYLKSVGLFAAAAPRAFPDENARKTYVLAPANIELNRHEAIFSDFKRTLSGLGASPIKSDVLVSLDYADIYLTHCRAARVEDGTSDLSFNPRNSVSGFYVASYMLLSQNAFTMINLSFMGLPPWLNDSIQATDDVEIAKEVIAEHRSIVRPLREKFQEENALLDTYRDFLTGHRMDALFTFCAAYGEFVVRQLNDPQHRFIRQFSVRLLNEVFRRTAMTGVDLTEFASTSTAHPGFHNIAYAIRRSTVTPQRHLAQFKAGQRPDKPLFDVRYGLGNNLRRKTDSASDFLTALTEFVQVYNAETVQEFDNKSEERGRDPGFWPRQGRRSVSPADLDDVLALVNKYGVQLVCNMLLAYGYASQGGRTAEERPGGVDTSGDDEQ